MTTTTPAADITAENVRQVRDYILTLGEEYMLRAADPDEPNPSVYRPLARAAFRLLRSSVDLHGKTLQAIDLLWQPSQPTVLADGQAQAVARHLMGERAFNL